MLSRTLKNWKVKNVQEQGSLEDIRLWRCLEVVCVFTRITEELDPWEVTEETQVMRNVFPAKQRSWGRRVCVIRRDVMNKQDPAAKREEAERKVGLRTWKRREDSESCVLVVLSGDRHTDGKGEFFKV